MEKIGPGEVEAFEVLDDAARELIRQSATFFVASCAPSDDGSSFDCDISHRGGKAGFIDVAGNQITVPGFAGNSFFNPLGNFVPNPRAGLLFVDFVIGDVVVLQGTTELLWNDPSIRGFKGAERLTALCHSRPEGAGCGDPSHRRDGRISSAWSRKPITWRKFRFHRLHRKLLFGVHPAGAIFGATERPYSLSRDRR
ncbi:hypothetical protein ACVWXO_000681 [Bradyrhizobium sp. LM2.7]